MEEACRQAGEDHAKPPGGGRVLSVHGTEGELTNAENARCYFAPNKGLCARLEALRPLCPAKTRFVPEAGACFCDAASSEVNNTCVPGTGCDEMVRRLKRFNVPASDARSGFYRNQTCIAEKSCAARGDMEDKDWLNKVVPDFVNPLIQKSGQWPDVMKSCEAYGRLPGLGAFACQREMANYHIKMDLLESLKKNGCGIEKDWDKVGRAITECVKTGIEKDLKNEANLMKEQFNKYADKTVQNERDAIRDLCMDTGRKK